MRTRRLLRGWLGLGLALAADFLVPGSPLQHRDPSGPSLARALAAQAQVTDDWLGMDGVVGTALGLDGQGRVVLKVYLSAPGIATLPRAVGDVPVQLEVTGPFSALGDVSEGLASSGEVDPKRSFARPVPIGVSAGHAGVTAGTIGARVSDGTDVYALSNNHVFANGNAAHAGDVLLQPGVADGGRNPDDRLATLGDFEPIRFCGGLMCPENRIDAALGRTTPADLAAATPEDGYGAPRSGTLEAQLGMAVKKYGRTTGLTQGRVTGVNATIDVSYRGGTARFVGQIMISGNGFSAPGDSGSLIVTDGALLADRRPVGLLFAGSSTNTLANPIDLVLERFGVTVDGG